MGSRQKLVEQIRFITKSTNMMDKDNVQMQIKKLLFLNATEVPGDYY
jgi:hypothetical protein